MMFWKYFFDVLIVSVVWFNWVHLSFNHSVEWFGLEDMHFQSYADFFVAKTKMCFRFTTYVMHISIIISLSTSHFCHSFIFNGYTITSQNPWPLFFKNVKSHGRPAYEACNVGSAKWFPVQEIRSKQIGSDDDLWSEAAQIEKPFSPLLHYKWSVCRSWSLPSVFIFRYIIF